MPVAWFMGLVGRGDGGRMGALGRVEEGRREVELGIEADSEGCWFMAAREEESAALLVVVIGA